LYAFQEKIPFNFGEGREKRNDQCSSALVAHRNFKIKPKEEYIFFFGI